MSFWSFLRDIFLLGWLFKKSPKSNTPTIHKDNDMDNDFSFDFERYYKPPRSSGYSHSSRDDFHSRSSWDGGHYASDNHYHAPEDDYYHDSEDDYAHDSDDFEDDY